MADVVWVDVAVEVTVDVCEVVLVLVAVVVGVVNAHVLNDPSTKESIAWLIMSTVSRHSSPALNTLAGEHWISVVLSSVYTSTSDASSVATAGQSDVDPVNRRKLSAVHVNLSLLGTPQTSSKSLSAPT